MIPATSLSITLITNGTDLTPLYRLSELEATAVIAMFTSPSSIKLSIAEITTGAGVFQFVFVNVITFGEMLIRSCSSAVISNVTFDLGLDVSLNSHIVESPSVIDSSLRLNEMPAGKSTSV